MKSTELSGEFQKVASNLQNALDVRDVCRGILGGGNRTLSVFPQSIGSLSLNGRPFIVVTPTSPASHRTGLFVRSLSFTSRVGPITSLPNGNSERTVNLEMQAEIRVARGPSSSLVVPQKKSFLVNLITNTESEIVDCYASQSQASLCEQLGGNFVPNNTVQCQFPEKINSSMFTGDGIFRVPAGVNSLTVTLVGGGGGGGHGNSGSGSVDGGGGGAGARIYATGLTVVPGALFLVRVGKGGTSDRQGTASAFGHWTDAFSLTAGGGSPGRSEQGGVGPSCGWSSTGNLGGAGGQTFTSLGYSSSSYGPQTVFEQGQSGSCGKQIGGGRGANNWRSIGGGGGGNGSTIPAGFPATAPGAGGGGGSNGVVGGAGANGYVLVEY